MSNCKPGESECLTHGQWLTHCQAGVADLEAALAYAKTVEQALNEKVMRYDREVGEAKQALAERTRERDHWKAMFEAEAGL